MPIDAPTRGLDDAENDAENDNIFCMLNYSFLYDHASDASHTDDDDARVFRPPMPSPPAVAAPTRLSTRKLREKRATRKVLETPAGKKQAKKSRSGWKCTQEYLLTNMTAKERNLLKKRKVAVPLATTKTPLLKHAEQKIRKELRKIRNVASAQKARLDQKNYIEELKNTIVGVNQTNAKLQDDNHKLQNEIHRILAENASLRNQLASQSECDRQQHFLL